MQLIFMVNFVPCNIAEFILTGCVCGGGAVVCLCRGDGGVRCVCVRGGRVCVFCDILRASTYKTMSVFIQFILFSIWLLCCVVFVVCLLVLLTAQLGTPMLCEQND